MLRWLSRYVKQINLYGVGIELREIPAEEALPFLVPASSQEALPRSEPVSQEPPPVVQKQDYHCVSGVSSSAQRTPRDLDLMSDGEGIQFHVHNPGATQQKVWVARAALQESLDHWETGGGVGPIVVAGRTARKEAEVVFVVDAEGEVEVQAGWWVWVPRDELEAAMEELGVRIPWR